MLDCTIYTNKAFLQLLNGNPQFVTALAESETWQEVVKVIDSLDISYTPEQLEYVWEKEWK